MICYKSWNGLNKQLSNLLCEKLKSRISYFLTRYHKVHNSYGRAAIRLDNKELVCFSWIEIYRQESDINKIWKETGIWDYENPKLKNKWDTDGTYHDMDFLSAATSFLKMPIEEALENENNIIRIFAILDRRIGKRTLKKIEEKGEYRKLPDWVRQFYDLRMEEIIRKKTHL